VSESDSQQVELIGTSLLEAELVRHGFEVAHPRRDRGIDLLVYRDEPNRAFAAVPVQIKASSGERFDLDRKYERLAAAGLVLVYIWKIDERPQFFLLTYKDALDVLGDAQKTTSWIKNGYYAFTNFVSVERKEKLRHFENQWDWLHRHLDAAAVPEKVLSDNPGREKGGAP